MNRYRWLFASILVVVVTASVDNFVELPVQRNVASLAYLNFAANPGQDTLQSLAQSASGYAHYAAATGTADATMRAQLVEDRWQRYSDESIGARGYTSQNARVPCNAEDAVVRFNIDADAAEWSSAVELELLSLIHI